jgi:hypothetical protein
MIRVRAILVLPSFQRKLESRPLKEVASGDSLKSTMMQFPRRGRPAFSCLSKRKQAKRRIPGTADPGGQHLVRRKTREESPEAISFQNLDSSFRWNDDSP